MKPDRGNLILILGILSLVLCAPLGIFAWVMGNKDIKEMNAGLMNPAGRSTTNAGRICGIIGTALLVLGGVAFVAAMALGLVSAVAHH